MEYEWERDGLIIVREFVDPALIDRYVEKRGHEPRRWTFPTPYQVEPTLRDLCAYQPLQGLIGDFLGDDPLLHLNLTGFRSTRRDWHQDGYLNPPGVGDQYLAVWMALDTIHPDAGPFEFVPGSHEWEGRLSRENALALGTPEQRGHRTWDKMWPSWTEGAVSSYWSEQIEKHDIAPRRFLPAEKGDLLVWSAWTVHRGCVPNDPTLERAALISHYSGAAARTDMPKRYRYQGALFADLPAAGRVS